MNNLNQEDALQFLTGVLSVPSVNGTDGERAMAEYLCTYLNSHGIAATLQPIDDRHANVIGRIPGKSDQTVIWNGHLDTVPWGKLDEWDTDPSLPIRLGNRIYARGASDMKSGLAAMAYVCAKMAENHVVPDDTILFLGTCDEEKGGLGAESFLSIAREEHPSFLLIGEPTGCRLGIAQKGCLWLSLSVNGKTSHGANPEEGGNALEGGFEVLRELKCYINSFYHEILGASTMQVTMAEGGIAPNMTPDHARFLADIRIVPALTRDMALHHLRRLCAEYTQKLGGKVTFDIELQNERMGIEIPKEDRRLSQFEEILRSQGLPVEYSGISYFTDASILLRQFTGCPVLLYGPGDPQLCHKPNESVDVRNYLKSLETYRSFYHRD
ncbi:M20 family metallopeptidase [Diplocloster agilis]|uniref:M20 family metallopeptidase n=1 Tax=Diplocloster agilis TaxID=2850323 RepID=A0A949K8M3_9FIRM|nr:M20 family metallopeptidase [Diplocloster agilis]MBU9738382.1 M20 family metallopeptidase [Diplocloster agilis]